MSAVSVALSINNHQTSHTHWAVGEDLGVLADIFDDAVTIAIMRRTLGPALRQSIQAQCGPHAWQLSWIGSPCEMLEQQLAKQLPAPAQAQALLTDVRLLAEATACLFEVERVAIRLRLLQAAMCPRFHYDNLPVRLVSTYSGPGSEWLPEAALERAGLGPPTPGQPETVRDASAVQQLAPGDVALLKGSGWIGNEGRGLVHRSPVVSADQKRLLLTIDPCF